jgi:hypothetical protein
MSEARRRRSSAISPKVLDFVERYLVVRTIVELGRARTFVSGHRLGVSERTPIVEIGGDAGRPVRMATGGIGQGGVSRAPLYHVENIAPCHGITGGSYVTAITAVTSLRSSAQFQTRGEDGYNSRHPGR